jgi:hypothetical protein
VIARALLVASALAVGCTDTTSTSTSDPMLTGNVCVAYTDAASCASNTACTWLGTGCACPPNDPDCGCPAGTCSAIDAGSGSGSGTATAGCVCSDGGVCVARNGQAITCVAPTPGGGDPCARLAGLTCQDSATIVGLCVCE